MAVAPAVSAWALWAPGAREGQVAFFSGAHADIGGPSKKSNPADQLTTSAVKRREPRKHPRNNVEVEGANQAQLQPGEGGDEGQESRPGAPKRNCGF